MPHVDERPRLSATIAPLLAGADAVDPREALAWISESGFRGVQLSAIEPSMRPREMSVSARRDLAATLRRVELECSGIDFLAPAAHFTDPTHMSRLFEALTATVELAASLGRAPVLISLAPDQPSELRAEIAALAAHTGVDILLQANDLEQSAAIAPPFAACIDCAAVLAAGGVPHELALRLVGKLGGVRLVDLFRSGLRGPFLEPRESRLDALSLRIALDTLGFHAMPVVDARQWTAPKQGLCQALERWSGLLAV